MIAPDGRPHRITRCRLKTAFRSGRCGCFKLKAAFRSGWIGCFGLKQAFRARRIGCFSRAGPLRRRACDRAGWTVRPGRPGHGRAARPQAHRSGPASPLHPARWHRWPLLRGLPRSLRLAWPWQPALARTALPVQRDRQVARKVLLRLRRQRREPHVVIGQVGKVWGSLGVTSQDSLHNPRL